LKLAVLATVLRMSLSAIFTANAGTVRPCSRPIATISSASCTRSAKALSRICAARVCHVSSRCGVKHCTVFAHSKHSASGTVQCWQLAGHCAQALAQQHQLARKHYIVECALSAVVVRCTATDTTVQYAPLLTATKCVYAC
jgi:hypothetical protein